MTIVTIGKSLIPIEQIALDEPFDLEANLEFKSEKDFKSRVVLLNRDAVLTEEAPAEFAAAHELHLIESGDIAVNKDLAFRVETFSAAGDQAAQGLQHSPQMA